MNWEESPGLLAPSSVLPGALERMENRLGSWPARIRILAPHLLPWAVPPCPYLQNGDNAFLPYRVVPEHQ